MEQTLILLVMLTGLTHAFLTPAETKCNATKNASLCSATLGRPVYIQMMMTNIDQLHFKKGLVKVFSLKNGKVNIQEAFKNRTEFFISNGTFKIISMEKSDVGQYIIEGFDKEGLQVLNLHVKLDVQESNLRILILSVGSAGGVFTTDYILNTTAHVNNVKEKPSV
ncbi:si:zfos-741a10.3 [Scomber scombrus]|uniref:Si:zfos-741a10.3 n=1 Tax=Scomber scombrus TaxID=13677 RepID=A0AAV1NDH5_SCOSC